MANIKTKNTQNAPVSNVPYAKTGAWIDSLKVGKLFSLDEDIIQKEFPEENIAEIRKALEFFAELGFVKWNPEEKTVELCARDEAPLEPVRQEL